jgi:hypothetical protein
MMPPKTWTFYDPEVWNLFVNPGEVVEVRILGAYGKSDAWDGAFAKGTVSGYFDDHKAFIGAIHQADKTPHGGIYFTLQVIDPRLIGRAFNRLKPSEKTTSDTDVLAYRWLPVDLDPVRPSGISSSDLELNEALDLRESVADWVMKERGFPSPIRAMSGNGGHLLFQLPDMPTSDETRNFIKRTMEGLAVTTAQRVCHLLRLRSRPGVPG